MSDPNILSWDNSQARKPWSEQLLKSIAAAKQSLDEANVEAFLPGYGQLDLASQIKFWAELVIAIAWFESKWNPNDIYHEPAPLNVDSVGLLQLSYEDAKPYHLEPLDRTEKSLQDPLVNLRCAVTILATLVSQNKVVEYSSGKKFGGASRYWSVIRQGHHVDEIRARVKDALSL